MSREEGSPGHQSASREEERGIAAVSERLLGERPVPGARFRGELRRSIVAAPMERPPHLRLTIAAYTLAGVVLLAVAAAGIANLGPLAPG